MRFSGLSFSYNLAYAIFGGLTPMAVALLLKQSPMGPAYYVVTLCLVGFLVGLYLLAQKSRLARRFRWAESASGGYVNYF